MQALETPQSTALADGADALADTLTTHFEPPHTPIVQPCDAKVDLSSLLAANPGCVRQIVFGACNARNPRADVLPRPGIIRPGGQPTWDFWCPHCHRSAECLPSQRTREGWEYGCPVHGPDVDLIEMECEPIPHGWDNSDRAGGMTVKGVFWHEADLMHPFRDN